MSLKKSKSDSTIKSDGIRGENSVNLAGLELANTLSIDIIRDGIIKLIKH